MCVRGETGSQLACFHVSVKLGCCYGCMRQYVCRYGFGDLPQVKVGCLCAVWGQGATLLGTGIGLEALEVETQQAPLLFPKQHSSSSQSVGLEGERSKGGL